MTTPVYRSRPNDGDRRLARGHSLLDRLPPNDRLDALLAMGERCREKAERDAECTHWEAIFNTINPEERTE
jgi:hypothetical protein